MSVEEEVELRDLVAQTLESNGCLSKIRAQLRANIFLALNEDAKVSKQQPLLNKKVKSYLEMPEGEIMFCLVREFLEFFDLDSSMSVYEPESYLGSCYQYEGRQSIIEKLGLKSLGEEISGPVLLHLVKIAQVNSKTLKINLTNINGLKADEVNGSEELCSSDSLQNEINGKSHVSDDDFSENNNESNNVSAINHTDSSKTGKKVIKDTFIINKDPALDATFIKAGDLENDNTFNGTSSIEDEENINGSVNGSDSNKKLYNNTKSEDDSSPESKSKASDKSKLSSKCDKLKSKLELSPLQLGKSRANDILPSLYNKDFKEKNKEFDFNTNDDYEEDFMSGSEVEFSLSKVDCPKALFDELQQCEKSVSFVNILPSEQNKARSTSSNINNSTHSEKSVSENSELNNSEIEEVSCTTASYSDNTT